jgi:hypothetical protein
MANNKIAEAKRVGNGFVSGKFRVGIRFKAKLLLAINLILVIFVIQDEARDILYFDNMTAQTAVSAGIIIMAVSLGLITYKLTRDLNQWEETYKKVKKILD